MNLKRHLLTISIIFVVLVAGLAYLGLRSGGDTEEAIVTRPERFFGFIRSVSMEGGWATLEVDRAEFLSGEEARIKGAEDTGCAQARIEECIPSMNNDFYIRNISTSTSQYLANASTVVSAFVSVGSPVLESSTVERFVSLYRSDPFIPMLPLNFVARGNMLEFMEQQYTP